ncbi:MAG: YfhO family protein [Armatimonadetes bacterium]|nr:YfhO family protein [Armatimonadota bacterium]
MARLYAEVKRAAWAPAACFLLVALILFWRFFLLGEVSYDASHLRAFYPWRASHEKDPRPVNPVLYDPLFIYYPQDDLYNQEVKNGNLPLWNPYNFCGHPLLANGRSAMLYPPRWLAHRFLDTASAHTVLLIFHFFLMGLGMYFLCRTCGLSRSGSLLGGLIWMLAGFNQVFLEFEFVTEIGALLPFSLAFVERIFASSGGPQRIKDAVFLSLTSSGMILVGHWQFVMYALLLLAAYGFFRLVRELRRQGLWPSIKCGLWVTLGVGLGILLCSAQLLPSLECSTLHQRLPNTFDRVFLGNRFRPENFLTLLVPDILGTPVDGFGLTGMHSVQNYFEQTAYVGVFPLILAGASLLWNFRRSLTWFFGAISIFVVACAAGTVAYWPLFRFAPGFVYFTPSRILFLFAFGVAVLAALGADRLLQDRKRCRRFCILVSGGAVISLAIAGAAMIIVQFLPDVFRGILAHYGPLGLFQPLFPGQTRQERILEVVQMMLSFYNWSSFSLLLPGIVASVSALLLWLYGTGRISGRRLVAALSVLVVLDLLPLGLKFNPTARREALFPPVPSLSYLKDKTGLFRVAGLYAGGHPNCFLPYRIQELCGYDSLIPKRFYSLAVGINGDMREIMVVLDRVKSYNKGLADLMNIRFHYIAPVPGLPTLLGKEVYKGKDLILRENETALPRAFLVRSSTLFKSQLDLLLAMLDPQFDPRKAAFLESEPPASLEMKAWARPLPLRDEVAVTSYRTDGCSISASLKEKGFLIISDTYYPGWKARVNGVEVPIFPAYYAFRGIHLPAGRFQVEVSYEPESFRKGVLLSLAGLSLLSGLVLFAIFGCRQRAD